MTEVNQTNIRSEMSDQAQEQVQFNFVKISKEDEESINQSQAILSV